MALQYCSASDLLQLDGPWGEDKDLLFQEMANEILTEARDTELTILRANPQAGSAQFAQVLQAGAHASAATLAVLRELESARADIERYIEARLQPIGEQLRDLHDVWDVVERKGRCKETAADVVEALLKWAACRSHQ